MKLLLTNLWTFIKHPRFTLNVFWHHFVRSNSVLRYVLYNPVRWLQGARRVDIRSCATNGFYSNAVCCIEFGGACPVQSTSDSEILGYECYYRARGEGWSFTVYSEEHSEIFDYYERCYYGYEGGWVPAEETIRNLEKVIPMAVIAIREHEEQEKRYEESGPF